VEKNGRFSWLSAIVSYFSDDDGYRDSTAKIENKKEQLHKKPSRPDSASSMSDVSESAVKPKSSELIYDKGENRKIFMQDTTRQPLDNQDYD
jgi:hypothetical protein